MMQRLKIVFTGPMGAGKTKAIASLSDTPVLSTDVQNTDLDAHANTVTTVGMDYGELTVEGGTNIGLYGTPGQERFSFLWPILVQGALGVIILVDHSAVDSVQVMARYLATFDKIYQGRIIIGVSHIDDNPERPFDIYREWLRDNERNLPIFPVDMRKKEDVLLLVETIITTLEQD